MLIVAGCNPNTASTTGGGGGGPKAKEGNGGGKASAGSVSRLNGGGSSFVQPMMKKWAGDYTKKKGVEIDYTSSGSANGISAMVDRKNDFGCTDAPMNEEQLAQAKSKDGDVLHIPLVMGGVVPL